MTETDEMIAQLETWPDLWTASQIAEQAARDGLWAIAEQYAIVEVECYGDLHNFRDDAIREELIRRFPRLLEGIVPEEGYPWREERPERPQSDIERSMSPEEAARLLAQG